MWPVYDWKNTRAFSLPTDQYGWIRVNLVGRESAGCVTVDSYDSTCREIEQMLLGLTTQGAVPLVQDVERTATNLESALSNPLPDLVVHWRAAAFESPLLIKDSNVVSEPIGKRSSGQHASEGFCVYRGPRDLNLDGCIAAKDLGPLITVSL